MRLARIDEVFPLTCPHGGAERRIHAVITEAVDVRATLETVGEPAIPPRIAQARGPPAWYEDSGDASHGEDGPASQGDPLAQPEPEYDYDHQVAW